ncbi:MAG TPA: uroporphyrinogen decarboxylase [Anaerolineae bacterium]|nr:uroporphyrinogen decarboxylase [Anaerolineae bacterium]HID84316.1 uroporphyrinogen decarboxylase [Anaerolineales bacterium]
MANEPQLRFLRACQGLPVDATPVWFMRQAGRYMPEYRAIRARYSLLEITRRPEVAAEVTLQPVEALGVDAAILFADILLPVEPMGLRLEFVPGRGPVIHEPVRTAADVARLRVPDPVSDLGHVLEAVRLVRRALEGKPVALIGFAGAPFTVASYIVEGGPSRHYRTTKRMMYAAPAVWEALMDKLANALAAYLVAQVEAGAQAVQLFDSWVGALSLSDYRRYVLPYSRRVLQAAMDTGVPVIHFGTGTGHLLEAMREAGGTVIGVDWREPLDRAAARLGEGVALQGNLDPVALFAPLPVLREQVDEVLRRAPRRGHIFNLGHGILPDTPVEAVRAVVEMVHERTAS